MTPVAIGPGETWVTPSFTILDSGDAEANGTASAPDGEFCSNDSETECS
jgi:hypothetical protein